MSVLYFSRSVNRIFKWNKIPTSIQQNSPLLPRFVRMGDAISIEYKKIRIVSKKFDMFGPSEIAIINNIRTIQTKEISPDNIIYYDKSVIPKKLNKEKVVDIDTFNPGEYGNSICYYSPSYQNNPITICTKFYEISERFGILNGVSKLLTFGSAVPKYGLYFSLAGEFLQGVDTILDKLTYKRELINDHVIEFDSSEIDRPLYYGSYICLPSCTQEDIKNILNNYVLDDNTLINTSDESVYDKSYFVLELNNIRDKSLYDFDFNYNANELLNKLDKRDKTGMEEFIQTSADSYNFKIIQDIVATINNPDTNKDLIPALYNRLSDKHQQWILQAFPNISGYINLH